MKKATIVVLFGLCSANVAFSSPNNVDCLVRVMYAEARGEPEKGIIGVGYTPVNRIRYKQQGTVCSVTAKRSQFARASSVSPKERSRLTPLAQGVISGTIPDPTGGATGFDVRPHRGTRVTTHIGHHYFYIEPDKARPDKVKSDRSHKGVKSKKKH